MRFRRYTITTPVALVLKSFTSLNPNKWLEFKLQDRAKYSNVVQALKRGDLRLLRQALQEHEDRWLRCVDLWIIHNGVWRRIFTFV